MTIKITLNEKDNPAGTRQAEDIKSFWWLVLHTAGLLPWVR